MNMKTKLIVFNIYLIDLNIHSQTSNGFILQRVKQKTPLNPLKKN